MDEILLSVWWFLAGLQLAAIFRQRKFSHDPDYPAGRCAFVVAIQIVIACIVLR